jgi:rod shape-determining protein MreC
MSKERRPRYLIAIVLALVSLPFFFFSSGLKPWEGSHSSVTLLQEVTYPFHYLVHYVSKFNRNVFRHYIQLTDVAEENTRLRRQLQILQTRIIDYEHQNQEVERLRKLIGFTEEYDREHILGEVVGHPPTAHFKSLRISSGRKDGIDLGMPVVTADGIIGKIVRAGMLYADVQLLIDSNFSLDVLLERTRVRAILQGIGGNRCILQIHSRAEIRIGDTVITSGITGSFPKGLPVGRVVRISYEADNVSQLIFVEPWVDYQRIEELMVIKKMDPTVNTIIETAGYEWIDKTLGKVDD